MEKNISLTFHHIGKPVSLQMIQHNKNTKYSPLFDMYSLDRRMIYQFLSNYMPLDPIHL